MPLNVASQQDMAKAIGIIAAIYTADSGVQNIADLALLAPTGSLFGGQFTKGPVPAFLWYVDGPQLIFFITGATIPQQGIGLFAGALGGQATVAGVSFNGYLTAAVNAIAASMQGKGVSRTQGMVACGHSYGGAIAQALLASLNNGVPNKALQILTFGSPRAGDSSLSGFCDNCTTVRVMTYGDPVPLFPPHFDEAPVGTFALGYAGALALSRFEQCGGGQLVDNNGNLTPAVLPPSVLPIADLNLVQWAAMTSPFLVNEHYYLTYLRRLTLPPLQYGPPVPTDGAGLKGEIEPVLTQAIFNLGPVLGPAALNAGRPVATISVYIPVAYRAKVVKVGTGYQVVWMNLTIGTGVTKSAAKTWAKYINKLLRVMQADAGSVNHTTIGQALQAYLTVASSATGGFMPILNVT